MNALKGSPRPSAIPIGAANATAKAKLFERLRLTGRTAVCKSGEMAFMKAENDQHVFRLPQTLEIARKVHWKSGYASDSHIPPPEKDCS